VVLKGFALRPPLDKRGPHRRSAELCFFRPVIPILLTKYLIETIEMASILLGLAILTATLLSTYIYTFFKNVIAGRKSGLPVIPLPVTPNAILWMVVAVPLRPWLKERLPEFIYRRLVLGMSTNLEVQQLLANSFYLSHLRLGVPREAPTLQLLCSAARERQVIFARHVPAIRVMDV
jgi:hypothetical protein